MLCNFCIKNQQVNPIANTFITPESHVFLPVKADRKIHLLHLNKDSEKVSVKTSQPKISFTNNKEPISSISNSISTEPNDVYKFNDLFESKEFTRQKSNGFNMLEGFSRVGYSIIYKRKIEVEDSADNDKEFLKASEVGKSLPLLFFIHGVGGNAKIWSNQLQFFYEQGYEIIAIDLIGHGQSNISKEISNYAFLEMALDVLLIFDMLHKSDNIVIGHSYGCSFGTYLAQCRQEFVSKLILISGGSPHPLDFKSPFSNAPLCLIQLMLPVFNCHFFCNAFNSFCNMPKFSNESFNISARTLLYTMKGQIWRAATESYHRKLKQPLLLIEGENDKFVPIDDALDMIELIKYGYLVVLKEGSHMVLIEQFEAINNLIYLFLNDDFKT